MAGSEATLNRAVTRYVERISRSRRLFRLLIRNNSACGSDFGITTGTFCRLFTCHYFGLVVSGQRFGRRLRNEDLRLQGCTLLSSLFGGRQGDRSRVKFRVNGHLRSGLQTQRTNRRMGLTACHGFVRRLRNRSMRIYRQRRKCSLVAYFR